MTSTNSSVAARFLASFLLSIAFPYAGGRKNLFLLTLNVELQNDMQTKLFYFMSFCLPPSARHLSNVHHHESSHKNLITLLLLVSAFVLLWELQPEWKFNKKIECRSAFNSRFVMNQNWIKLFRNYNSYRNIVLEFFRHVVLDCRLVYLMFLTITFTFDNINQINCLLSLRLSLF